MNIQNLWYRNSVLTYLLRPLSWLFRFIVFCRRCLYRLGLKKTTHFSVPVIVAGNVTTGGAGKTPLVAWLANALVAKGYRPGIVSRGFQGQSKQWPLLVTANSDPKMVGDEPVLLAHRTQCPVVVDPNRVAAVQYLLEHNDCDVVISDDGLQHYALGRDIEIAVVDGLRHFGNRQCLPAGPLREPLHRLRQVDFIVCNGAQEPGWFAMELKPGDVYSVADHVQQLSLDACRQRQWHAVAGIGHPERFFLQLENMGLTIQGHGFPDHYAFTQRDLEFDDDRSVIMTEKDAVKCRDFADQRYWCLPVTAELPEAFSKALFERLSQ